MNANEYEIIKASGKAVKIYCPWCGAEHIVEPGTPTATVTIVSTECWFCHKWYKWEIGVGVYK